MDYCRYQGNQPFLCRNNRTLALHFMILIKSSNRILTLIATAQAIQIHVFYCIPWFSLDEVWPSISQGVPLLKAPKTQNPSCLLEKNVCLSLTLGLIRFGVSFSFRRTRIYIGYSRDHGSLGQAFQWHSGPGPMSLNINSIH